MPHSSQVLTQQVLNSSLGPEEAMQRLWDKTRYLVAQEPVDPAYTQTVEGYYKGCQIVPGPKADPKITPHLAEQDLQVLIDVHHITFIDNQHTDGAEPNVYRANYGIMTNDEAVEYEDTIRHIRGKARKNATA